MIFISSNHDKSINQSRTCLLGQRCQLFGAALGVVEVKICQLADWSAVGFVKHISSKAGETCSVFVDELAERVALDAFTVGKVVA